MPEVSDRATRDHRSKDRARYQKDAGEQRGESGPSWPARPSGVCTANDDDRTHGDEEQRHGPGLELGERNGSGGEPKQDRANERSLRCLPLGRQQREAHGDQQARQRLARVVREVRVHGECVEEDRGHERELASLPRAERAECPVEEHQRQAIARPQHDAGGRPRRPCPEQQHRTEQQGVERAAGGPVDVAPRYRVREIAHGLRDHLRLVHVELAGPDDARQPHSEHAQADEEEEGQGPIEARGSRAIEASDAREEQDDQHRRSDRNFHARDADSTPIPAPRSRSNSAT